MLSSEQNDLLTRVSADVPMGRLFRQYWHPFAAEAEMRDRWTMRVRLLGEDLVLFKDRQGRLGLIAEQCPHRRASLAYGIPTDEGICCCYHGWMMDKEGRCLDQPNEDRAPLKGKSSRLHIRCNPWAGFFHLHGSTARASVAEV